MEEHNFFTSIQFFAGAIITLLLLISVPIYLGKMPFVLFCLLFASVAYCVFLILEGGE